MEAHLNACLLNYIGFIQIYWRESIVYERLYRRVG